jgi:hypothetical protein
MAEISSKDLGWLLWCAISYDRRLPSGNIPDRLWGQLSTEQRQQINHWEGARIDGLGAEIRAGLRAGVAMGAPDRHRHP